MLEGFFKVGDGTGPRQAAADYAVALAGIRDFTVTGQHLALLRRASIAWCALEPYGSPAVDPNRPYGNSSVFGDIAEITDPDGFAAAWPDEAAYAAYMTAGEERFLRLHVETMVALRIALSAGEFKAGRYTRPQRFGPWRYAGPAAG